jgi:hypothetical protein
VPTAVSLFSNTQVPPQQIAWLLNQFEALQDPSGQSWVNDVGPGIMDVVGVADGTDDLALMPRVQSTRQLNGSAARRSTDLR